MQYHEQTINVNLNIVNLSEPTRFLMDGKFRQIINGTIDIGHDGVVIVLNAADARMTIRQIPEGWEVTEEKFQPSSV